MPRLGGPHPHDRLDAEVEQVTRVLEGFKVLTRGRLREFSHAGHWHGGEFDIRTGYHAGTKKLALDPIETEIRDGELFVLVG